MIGFESSAWQGTMKYCTLDYSQIDPATIFRFATHPVIAWQTFDRTKQSLVVDSRDHAAVVLVFTDYA